MKPLVSILIPAYNAEATIADTLRSAVGQTWQRKEIFVIDDGSRDRTAEIAKRFACNYLQVISTENGGLSAAINHGLRLCQGEYIQELDADDILATDKIERQLLMLRAGDSKRVALASAWAPFFHRTRGARFVQNSLCQDLSPAEWLLRKMSENLHMQNATWLVSRELAEAAGPWNERLRYDQDGEYFARVLLASAGTRFVPGTGVFYRVSGPKSISYIGNSGEKQDSLLLSMKLHIGYLRSLEESDRVRNACLVYLQNWFSAFYPERSDLVAEVQALAAELGGHLETPRLRWKYNWMTPIFGLRKAKWAQNTLPQVKASFLRRWDRTMYQRENQCESNLRDPGELTYTSRGVNTSTPASAAVNSAGANAPLVSILIPAYNTEAWIAETLKSAIAQTWPRKEIIVVDDTSNDDTFAVARQFESEMVRVVRQEKSGASAARNYALRLSKGDYIQWLDADDILAPDKIERQVAAGQGASGRLLLSSPWGTFYYRTERAMFRRSALWHDLSPVDWLLTKMSNNLHMQTANWLVSRELSEAAGPWDTRLLSDDDGEYFSRVVMASEGTRFVDGAGVYWRINGFRRLSYIGSSDPKKDALLLSMKLHIQYLRSLEDSKRVHNACLKYLQNWFLVFYPDRPDLIVELEAVAASLEGQLNIPLLRWKYQWMQPLFGWKTAKWAQNTIPQFKASCIREWDKAMYCLDKVRVA